MTDIMAQPGLGLTAPSSRQDVISALLNDYGNSFGQANSSSPYSLYSPVPAMKELPPPPPDGDGKLYYPPSMMSMRFQLRVDDSDPESPVSPACSSPSRITSRNLSRNSKPPSLRLLASNGSTAIVPPTPALSATSSVPSSKPPAPIEERPLPPPPPEKSERRSMGNSKSALRELRARKDSTQSQVSNTSEEAPKPANQSAQESGPMKRKPLKDLTKKVMSIADLGNGRRGGKNGPLPALPQSRQQRERSADNMSSNSSSVTVTPATAAEERSSKTSTKSNASSSNRKPLPSQPALLSKTELPPTPDDQPAENALPPPPKKAFLGMGLPSNPRARGQIITPRSSKGSTVSDAIKPTKGPVNTELVVNTLTPDHTPSPHKAEAVQAGTAAQAARAQSPVSPLSPENETDDRRPFSFEGRAARTFEAKRPAPPPPKRAASPVSPPAAAVVAATSQFASRNDTRLAPQPQSQPQQLATQPIPLPPPADSSDFSDLQPPSFRPYAQLSTIIEKSPQTGSLPTIPIPAPPSTTTLPPLPPKFPFPTTTFPSTFPSPFPPSTTSQPSLSHPLPAPAITSHHLTCYTAHSTSIWSSNAFAPQPCMVCGACERYRSWACVWCYLRVCGTCAAELDRVPGRDLGVLVGRRGCEKNKEM
ncbi:hypothetical protein BDV95DRAFT_188781 [Massariosphaeria phaeospora]|uniref:Uncharacterized protein n=1 Tax=Massariosphaeria phaeospora TaxID=100035 RepID=A0A7C8I8U9_9PLEO|nr:hypothetical protein BDV95DRAFT_188781 [Massariosphaeria phaeospora]